MTLRLHQRVEFIRGDLASVGTIFERFGILDGFSGLAEEPDQPIPAAVGGLNETRQRKQQDLLFLFPRRIGMVERDVFFQASHS